MVSAAIITADIVNFTLLSPKQEKKLISAVELILQPNLVEFYRGDSFQALVKEPELALQLVLKIRATARKLSADTDIRSSIGIGSVNTNIKKLTTTSDPAFVLSGRAFDEMEGTDSKIRIVSEDITQNKGLKLTALFADHIFRKMTVKQAEVVFELLSGYNQQVTAKRLKKSQPTVNKHLQSASWGDLTRLLNIYQDIILNR